MKKANQILILSAFLLTFMLTKTLNVMQDTEEIWKDIVGYEGYYQISNHGRIKSIKKGIFKKAIKNWSGYPRIQLIKETKGKIYSVHRLVAMAFVPNPNNYPVVNHKDHCRHNNLHTNLEWCTLSYNTIHSFTKPNRKIARAWLGKKGYLHHASMPVMRKLNGIVVDRFEGLADAGRKLGIRDTSIGRVCRGERKSYKGYQWEFV